MECTNTILEQFSNNHFTYINQIFGDGLVREIIMEVYPNDKYEFYPETVEDESGFESGFHHVLISKKTNKSGKKKILYCSVEKGYQDLTVNKNDTLCQSYSIMEYLNIHIDKYFKEDSPYTNDEKSMLVQRDMIKTYREKLLKDDKFIEQFHTVDFEKSVDNDGKKAFRNYTKKNAPPLNMDSIKILEKVHNVLDEWEKYGYRFFIGKGKCKNKEKVEDLNTVLKRIEMKSKSPQTDSKNKSGKKTP